MQSRLRHFQKYFALFIAVVFVVGLCVIDADAQRRRKRRVRTTPRPVITNPEIAPAGSESIGPDGERIISTVDDPPADSEAIPQTTGAAKTRAQAPADAQSMRRTINALSSEVNKLNEKLDQMEENDRSHLDMERLTRAEQRAENVRTQLLDVESKLADLQPRLEQIEYGLKPEVIERSAAGFGTVRPEEVRETRRRQLENEKARVQAQIRILESSRTRLEAAITTADAEVDRLRRRLEAREMQEQVAPATPETRRPATPTPPQ
ncbi:MAG TPA: hypothetical protein VNO50_09490 [Pyrinomonadaceae bacterium]|nr:hypothetical protein [Pyrinomonadaceae bacterium]